MQAIVREIQAIVTIDQAVVVEIQALLVNFQAIDHNHFFKPFSSCMSSSFFVQNIGKHKKRVDEDMRRRIGGSLFSLALILFLAGISFEEDFWTKAPGDRSPLQQSQDESPDSAESYDHDNPRVSPIDLAKEQKEGKTTESTVDKTAQPSFIHENGLSILMIQDVEKTKAHLHFVTYQPEEHAVYVSTMKDYDAQIETKKMVEKLESDLNYPLDYYIRMDKSAMKNISKDVMENAFVQQTLEKHEDQVVGDSKESLNLGSLVKDMSQLSIGTLMSLNKLVTSLSQKVETNLSVAEVLSLRSKYGVDAFLEPLEVKRGLEFRDSVPVMKEERAEDSRTVSEMMGGL
ncbi:hypothetical protein [Pontibacillus marinus]|uniref:Uncharacterized protein n=1 Tax=Pontibacillus marinus BH030004 = DSM 16465 TaxID=1385511 RepID=A0A0A5FXT2_9BACI|nr:hypothetical protein [Pontibacillus marinus]KGX83625.1 hypothetical protein N783_11345 [Pontibacillus marinus BH030004 = DSM 16465]